MPEKDYSVFDFYKGEKENPFDHFVPPALTPNNSTSNWPIGLTLLLSAAAELF